MDFDQAIRQIGNNDYLASSITDLNRWNATTDSRIIVEWIRSFLAKVTSPLINYHGILLVFDEMGKPLEYASTHPDEVDVNPLAGTG